MVYNCDFRIDLSPICNKQKRWFTSFLTYCARLNKRHNLYAGILNSVTDTGRMKSSNNDFRVDFVSTHTVTKDIASHLRGPSLTATFRLESDWLNPCWRCR